MTKVSVNHRIYFSAESPPIAGELSLVENAVTDMFKALRRFELDKGITLKDIRLGTTYETEDWADQQIMKYRIDATYDKAE